MGDPFRYNSDRVGNINVNTGEQNVNSGDISVNQIGQRAPGSSHGISNVMGPSSSSITGSSGNMSSYHNHIAAHIRLQKAPYPVGFGFF